MRNEALHHLTDATFQTVILQDENQVGLSYHVLGFYKSVSADLELRKASLEAVKSIEEFEIESAMDESLYMLVEAVYSKAEKLDPESQRLVEKMRRNFVRNGLKIPEGSQRERFREI